MTIRDFEWSYFWDFGQVSWCEVATVLCFGFGLLASAAGMLKNGRVAGNGRQIGLALAGFVFGIAHKLFCDLDVVVLLYVFFAVVAFSNLTIRYSIASLEGEVKRVEARRTEVKRRGESTRFGGKSESSTSGGETSSRRSSRQSSSSDSSSGGSSETRRRSHSHSHLGARSHSHSHSRRQERDVIFDALEPDESSSSSTTDAPSRTGEADEGANE